jgi:hypothetical protein
MHGLIAAFTVTDHRDGNRLNNQRSNLRACTHSQNGCNRAKLRATASQYKGVRLLEGKWAAEIRLDGKRAYLGRFLTEEDAAIEYNRAALKIHGEFARLNVIQGCRSDGMQEVLDSGRACLV